MGRQFVEKWVLNERDDSVNRELDVVRSGFPLAGTGFAYLSATEFTALISHLSTLSTRIFRLNRMILDNDAASPNRLILYNGPSAPVVDSIGFRMKIAGSQTEFINGMDVPFSMGISGGLYASNAVNSLWVRVQGVLILSE